MIYRSKTKRQSGICRHCPTAIQILTGLRYTLKRAVQLRCDKYIRQLFAAKSKISGSHYFSSAATNYPTTSLFVFFKYFAGIGASSFHVIFMGLEPSCLT